MKRFYMFLLVITSLLITQFSYAQNNVSIDTQYRMKPDRTVAKESNYFGFYISEGKLYTNDKDLNIQKQYYIKFKNTIYDNAGLFNLAYETDVVKHTLNSRPKSEVGIFLIIYDEKNGKIVGVRIIKYDSDDTFLTEFGAKFLNKI